MSIDALVEAVDWRGRLDSGRAYVVSNEKYALKKILVYGFADGRKAVPNLFDFIIDMFCCYSLLHALAYSCLLLHTLACSCMLLPVVPPFENADFTS